MVNPTKRVTAGDPPLFSASRENLLSQAIEAMLAGSSTPLTDDTVLSPHAIVVRGKNNTADPLKVGDAVRVSTPISDPNGTGNLMLPPSFVCDKPNSDSELLLLGCIVRGAPAGKPVRIAMLGVVWARVDVSNASHKLAKPVSGNTTLASSSADGLPILWKPSGTGVKKCAVLFDRGAVPRIRIGKTDASVAPGGTVTVSIWRRESGGLVDTNENITNVRYDWIAAEAIAANKQVEITYFADESVWRITDAECP